MAQARPLVSVQDQNGQSKDQTALPAVFSTPLRVDIVQIVHTNMSKNSRQPYAVNMKAGHQTAAESWGTGRAVSRIPRVPGGGTHRAGQGAFGNMCRGGRMFAPTKIWRKWHRKINLKQKRYAVSAALAASALPSLVMARGHRISQVPEIPLVVADNASGVNKTKQAVQLLEAIGAKEDVDKAKDSKQIRSGRGKIRNRRYVNRKGPLVVYGDNGEMAKAFRNITGVDVCSVDRLNLLQLAPGGHVGRFIIWTKSAFDKLDSLYGTADTTSSQKGGWKVPSGIMQTVDLARLINSDEIQSVVKPVKSSQTRAKLKRNPLNNLGAMLKLNPYAKTAKRLQLTAEKQRTADRAARAEEKRKAKAVARTSEVKSSGKAFYQQMIKDSDYLGEDYDVFSSWLGTTS